MNNRALALLVLGTAPLSAGCLGPFRDRPSALETPGVRVGGEWLKVAPLYEDARLGSITDLVMRTKAAELGVVGTHGAAFLPSHSDGPRFLAFVDPAGDPRLLEWADGRPRYLDRGGGGWQTGALVGPDGTRLWRPEARDGMDDLAGGDLDGDGVPEFVVGYNGGGGVRLLDASGKERWQKDDGNVWHVEIVDTDGDGNAEIIHSNAAGQLTLRDASGKVLGRARVPSYFSDFSLVEWPPQRKGVLHATNAGTDVVDFDGNVRAHLETPDTTFLCDARGTAASLGRGDYLVLTVSLRNWDRTQLFVFDQGGVLRYREVVSGVCGAVAAPEADAFLFGCGSRVLRYATQAASPP